jgi:hypothetical protein
MNKPEDNPEMRILKTATCKSTSGKSTLTYQIGCMLDNTIHIRITKNSSAGFFNDEWIALKDIEKVLVNGPKGQGLAATTRSIALPSSMRWGCGRAEMYGSRSTGHSSRRPLHLWRTRTAATLLRNSTTCCMSAPKMRCANLSETLV